MIAEKALTIAPVSMEAWQVIQSVAPVAQASRMFGVTQEQAAIIMLTAHELGFGYAPALNGLLYVVATKTGKRAALSAQAMNALIQHSDKLAEMEITDHTDDKGNPNGCTVRMKRADNGFEHTTSFMEVDAERAGLLDKTNWQKWPAEMYFSRAVTKCGRRVVPDAISGMYTVEELGMTVNAEGEPIETVDAIYTVKQPESELTKTQDAAPPSVNAVNMTNLIAKYGAEAILAANGGTIPATTEDCARIAEKLAMEAGNA